jgi:Tfp pilus assembly protein FimT
MTWVVGELMTGGRVHRAVLGVVGQTRPVNRRVQREFNLSEPTAVEVMSLLPDGPAKKAGVRERDVIVSMDGQGIASIDDLQRVLMRASAGNDGSSRSSNSMRAVIVSTSDARADSQPRWPRSANGNWPTYQAARAAVVATVSAEACR